MESEAYNYVIFLQRGYVSLQAEGDLVSQDHLSPISGIEMI